jgi:hypothetical protein
VIVELIVLDWMLPLTVKAVRLPKLVILLSVPGSRIPLNVPPMIVPGTVKLPISPLTALNDAEVVLPTTVRFVSDPTVVING